MVSLPIVYAVLTVLCVIWVGLFVRFDGQLQLKRVTLTVNKSEQSADHIRRVLHNVDGVVDVNPVLEKHVVYLKVEQHFNEQLAHDALARQ